MSRRAKKIVSKAKATTYGVALQHHRQAAMNKYSGKPYGPHRSAIAANVRAYRSKARSSGISPHSKALRGPESVRTGQRV